MSNDFELPIFKDQGEYHPFPYKPMTMEQIINFMEFNLQFIDMEAVRKQKAELRVDVPFKL